MEKTQPASKEKCICERFIHALASSPTFRRANPQMGHHACNSENAGRASAVPSPWQNKLAATSGTVATGFAKLLNSPENKLASEVPVAFEDSSPAKKGRARDASPRIETIRPSPQLQVNRQPKVKKEKVPVKKIAADRKASDNGASKSAPTAKAFMDGRIHDFGKKHDVSHGIGEGGKTPLATKTTEFTEYIDRAGRKIRTPTIACDADTSLRKDSFNDKVTDFINRAKHRFHNTPSDVENFQDVIRRK